MAQLCKKCKKETRKTQTLFAGNSRYDIYQCDECGNEEKICRGIVA